MTTKELESLPEMTTTKQSVIFTFPHIERFHDIITSKTKWKSRHSDKGWTGETFEESCKLLATGKNDLVPEAEKLIAELSATLPDRKPTYVPDIVGDYVMVPDYMAGAPEHFRRRDYTFTTSSPIRLYLGVAASAGIDWEQMQQRGIVMLALTMKLAEERPIELYVYDGSGTYSGTFSEGKDIFAIYKINTTPLDLGMASYLLTSQGFVRNLIFTFIKEYGFSGGWPKVFNTSRPLDAEPIRKAIGAEPHDLVVPMAYLHDEPIYKEPLKWLNENLTKCRSIELPD